MVGYLLIIGIRRPAASPVPLPAEAPAPQR
jgi:hypothetical protein